MKRLMNQVAIPDATLDPKFPLEGSDPNPLKGPAFSNPPGFEGPRAVWSVWDVEK